MTTTQTCTIGRYTLSLTVAPSGRILEVWSPRPPVRLTPAELKRYHNAKSAFAAPILLDAIPRGAKTRRNVNGKTVARREPA